MTTAIWLLAWFDVRAQEQLGIVQAEADLSDGPDGDPDGEGRFSRILPVPGGSPCRRDGRDGGGGWAG